MAESDWDNNHYFQFLHSTQKEICKNLRKKLNKKKDFPSLTYSVKYIYVCLFCMCGFVCAHFVCVGGIVHTNMRGWSILNVNMVIQELYKNFKNLAKVSRGIIPLAFHAFVIIDYHLFPYLLSGWSIHLLITSIDFKYIFSFTFVFLSCKQKTKLFV